MKRIERQAYLQKLIAFKDKKLIKVITGIRRCGKSTIMEIYRWKGICRYFASLSSCMR